ncbi:MAG: M14 family metallopeptidase [Xanthomonadaceae bacterium]|nr:M14 family metallopeptidase [Xanthomonadaceae bacterium]
MSVLRIAAAALAFTFAAPVTSAPLEYYLPEGVSYDASIPEPAAVIGHEVGEWHITHDRLVHYMRTLAEHSDRVQWHETGRTHEGRPLLLLAISSPANLARLEEIRNRHLALSDPRRAGPDVTDMPAVAWLGYSVHGNEPSGSNAAPVVAYHLAAAQDEWTRQLLDRTVILFDPSFNPDGLQRFSTWANMHRGHTPSGDPQSREHNEGWPSGRTNHYGFDLNRDWLLLVHPESRARITEFQRWRPNLLTDHHEMGSSATYFFQPGVQTRQNPLLPQRTFDLHLEIARYHADALDEVGVPYYTREGFDDFYLGKGSTYPDLQGSIGILFEQASSRGHLQETPHGELSFPLTIRNQVLTSFSSLRAVLDKRVELLRWQREFYETAYAAGRRDATRGWVFGDDGDPARGRQLVEVLLAHGVEVHPLARGVTIDGHEYAPGAAWVVPTGQPQYLLARGIFERRTEFVENTFYDVSSWTLPLAFGLPHAELRRQFGDRLLGDRLATAPQRAASAPVPEQAVAYAFEWSGYFAPRALHRLLAEGVRARASTEALTLETADGPRAMARGTIVIPTGIQDEVTPARLRELLAVATERDDIIVHAIRTGLSVDGIDVGSPSLKPLELPRVALVVGPGVNIGEAGETWHLLDNRFEMPVTLLEITTLQRMDLGRYTHLVLPNGNYDAMPPVAATKIRDWVRAGGILVATKGGARWAVNQELASVEFQAGPADIEQPERRDYADARGVAVLQLLRGAIFETDLDTTHPLGWGIPRRSLPVFRDSSTYMKLPSNPYVTPVRYTAEPLLSGYVSPENLRTLAGTAAVVAMRSGAGAVVLSADNLNFRGYWYGTNRVFMNAIFFGSLIEATPIPD